MARRTGRPLKTINEIIKGKTAITAETALQFERTLGVPASFWNNLERNYREALAALNERKALERTSDWVKTFPIKELVKRKALANSNDRVEVARGLLQFLGLAVPVWTTMWTASGVAYRRSPAFQVSREATAAWLRLGELEAMKQQLPPFNREAFRKALKRIRRIMGFSIPEMKNSLVEECNRAGVAIVFIKELPGTRVHGAVRWVAENPVIQLSCRYKVEDIFWFSFFHEAGHVLLHGRRDVFLEDGSQDGTKETEADDFATTQLVSATEWRSFCDTKDFSETGVRAFAQRIDIPLGIVVGRLQHEKLISHSKLNPLKRRFDLTETLAA